MGDVRIGIIGCGNMGSSHARQLADGNVTGATLGAVCDSAPDVLAKRREQFGEKVPAFASAGELYASGSVDAVIIATPHYDHPPLTMEGIKSGHHVLSEKPVGVYTKQVREMNEVADANDRIFAVMFNQRVNPMYKKLKDVLDSGELGALKRNSWIITTWYRSQSYYDSGTWRATWKGEGGGVLVNQCPHQLDLWQWFCGMPKRVRAFCSFGKYRDIEVEDDVTAYVEYEDGSTGTFIATTGEAPGTNRFEIAGDRGRLVLEGGKLHFDRTRVPESQFNAEYKSGFGKPESWPCEIPFRGRDEAHLGVMKGFVQAIRKGDPSLLVARGQEGIRNVELANAMLLSTWIDGWVDVPVDEELFLKHLNERIAESRDKETGTKHLSVDGTF